MKYSKRTSEQKEKARIYAKERYHRLKKIKKKVTKDVKSSEINYCPNCGAFIKPHLIASTL